MLKRTKKLAKRLKEPLIVTRPENLFYLTGKEVAGYLIFTRRSCRLYMRPFYQYTKLGISKNIYSNDKELESALLKLKAKAGAESIKTDAQGRKMDRLRKVLGKVEYSDIVERSRMIKTAEELRRIKKASKVSAIVMERIYKKINLMRTEWDILELADCEMRKMGVTNAFDTIVHVNSLEPHRPTSNRALNGLVIVDLGARYMGYCSDMTRTFLLNPTEEQTKLCDYTKIVQEKVIGKIHAGVRISKIVRYAESLVKKKYSLKKNYLHSVGHGVGIDIHEMPFFSEESKLEFEEGMVFTIEPGIYVKGVGGARWEDTLGMEKGVVIYSSSTSSLS